MKNVTPKIHKTKKRILVTGGTGFVGRVVVRELSKLYKVRVFSRKKVKINGVEIFVGNILDVNDVEIAIENVDCIVHLAALMVGNEKYIYSFNVNSTKVLIDAAIKNNIRKFVFLSSENTMWEKQSAYGESKKKCEEYVKKSSNYLILRSTAIYGKGSNVILGKVLNYVKNSRFIFIPGNGKSLMQPIYVGDVSKYIYNGIKYDVKGTYIIAGKSKVSFNKFIDTSAKILKVKRTKIHVPLWILYPAVFILELIFKNPPIKHSQMKNLNTDRVYTLDDTINSLKYSPIDVLDGLKKTLI